MTTKDKFLKAKQKFVDNDFSQTTDNGNQYSNLNLNQNQKCSILIPVQTCSKSTDHKKCAICKLPDSAVSVNYEGKSQSWNNSSNAGSCSKSLTHNKNEKEGRKRWTKSDSSNTKNSTLSLHIKAYENSTESDSLNAKNIEKQGSTKTTKLLFSSPAFAVQNPFEFPRQQNDKVSQPEMSQFRASQRLLDPNKSSKKVRKGIKTDMEESASETSLDSFNDAMPPPLLNRGDELSMEIDKADELQPLIIEPPTLIPIYNRQHNCGICHQAINNIDKKDLFSAGGFKKGDTQKSDEWIQCNLCYQWFHIACEKIEEYETKLIDEYHCSECSKTEGNSIMKKVIVPHRYDFWKESEKDKKPQIGTKPWIEDLIAKEATFPEFSNLKLYEDGYDFERNFDYNSEWKQPLKVLKNDGLKLELPDGDFDLDKIVELVGRDEEIQVIDVYMQESNTMSMGAFYDRWKDEKRERLYNMLSFEFSHTKLMDLIRAPDLMYKLSWVHRFWPHENEPSDSHVIPEHLELKPDVAMFCLLGMGGSYTDFHIDFGGSSVWYHVFKGKKVFYVIEPCKLTLDTFVKWTNGPNRSEEFLKDRMPEGLMKRVEINEGETLMIPSGWIHAVYTPVDSIVFGGNFIHELNITRQLQVYDVELKCSYDDHFLFPSFELTNWYAAYDALERFGSLGNDALSIDVIEGFRTLIPYLKKWVHRDKLNDDSYKIANVFRDTIPKLELMIKEYDKNMHEDAPYDPLNESKSSLKLKIKMNGSVNGLPRKRDSAYEKAEEKVQKLSKKDNRYVKNMFQHGKTHSGRIPKPSEWLKESVVGFESQPGPSSNNSKNFYDGFSPELRAMNEKVNGDDNISTDDDDEDIERKLSKKKRKMSANDSSKEPKTPKTPKPAKAISQQERIFKKLKMIRKK